MKFRRILADSWFASVEDMRFIERKNKKFIFEANGSRLAAANGRGEEAMSFYQDRSYGNTRWGACAGIFKGFQAILYKPAFKNKGGTVGVRHLAANGGATGGDRFKAPYKKRRGVEAYRESIKQNTLIGSSPAHRARSQSNHIFASIYGYVKLESARLNRGYNHFAIKSQIYLASLKRAMELLSAFNPGDNGPLA
ncbi:MAG: hypothetical protein LBD58_12690 [Treponema sp.]|nr:hypothetical protein [Treponema sp.]